MGATQSTLAATQESFSKQQDQPSESVVTQEGNIQTPATDKLDTPTDSISPDATPTQSALEQQEDIVDFSLSIGKGSNNPEQSKSEAQPQPSIAYNWEDEIKKVDRNEVLKKLGVSDFALEMDAHILAGGDPADYLNAKAIDYNKISDQELVKQDLKKQYPNFSDEEIQKMFNRRYGIKEDMLDEEKEDILLELKAKAYNIRQLNIADQQKFKIASAVPVQQDENYQKWKEQSAANEQIINQLNQFYQNHQATKSLNESKRVTISFGDGVKPLNFQIDKPELITNSLIDGGQTYLQAALNDQGEPDVARQQLVSLFAFNPQKFIQTVFNYGKSMGVHSKVTEGQNATKPVISAAGGSPNDGQQKVSQGRLGDLASRLG